MNTQGRIKISIVDPVEYELREGKQDFGVALAIRLWEWQAINLAEDLARQGVRAMLPETAEQQGVCEMCRFFQPETTLQKAACRRFPNAMPIASIDYWCGEFQQKAGTEKVNP